MTTLPYISKVTSNSLIIKVKSNMLLFFFSPLHAFICPLNTNLQASKFINKCVFFFFKIVWRFSSLFKKYRNVRIVTVKKNIYKNIIFTQINLRKNYLYFIKQIKYDNDSTDTLSSPKLFFLHNFLILQLTSCRFFFKTLLSFNFFFAITSYFKFVLYLNKYVLDANYQKIRKRQSIYLNKNILSFNNKLV